MRTLHIILMLVLASFLSAPALAEVDPLAQYQQAVQIRMDDLVRSATREFFEKSGLTPVDLKQVITTPKFQMTDNDARITSVDLRIVMATDHPAEVVRQLRQYVAQMLDREGFVLDQFADVGSKAPRLSLTLDVQDPGLAGLKFDLYENWREYVTFALILLAFLSSLFFAGYMLILPVSARRRQKKVLAAKDIDTNGDREGDGNLLSLSSVLPTLPDSVNSNSSSLSLPSLDEMLATEKQRQNFPVWLDKSGVRMADVDAIKKAFEVLPFEEALDLLSCMEETDRNVILNQLKLNGSVRSRIKKELMLRTPAFNR